MSLFRNNGCSDHTIRGLAVAVVFSTISGCSFDLGRLQGYDSGIPMGDGAMPVGDGGTPVGDGGTGLDHPPGRPTITDDSTPGDVLFGLIQVSMSHSPPSSALSFGFDLDDRWTTATNPDLECAPTGTAPVDGNNGVDNQFGAALYPLLNSAIPGWENQVRNDEGGGRDALILRLRGWNQTPNDPQIEVTVASSVFSAGVHSSTPPAVTINSPTDYNLTGGGAVPDPNWDGMDWTWLRADDFAGGNPDMPNVSDPHAYISNGTLVVTLPTLTVRLMEDPTHGVVARLGGVQIVAHLASDGHLDSVFVTGRWANADLLATGFVCPGTAQYSIFNSQLQRQDDVRGTIPSPGDPTLPCDAISTAIGFTGFRTQFGGVTPGATPVSPCP